MESKIYNENRFAKRIDEMTKKNESKNIKMVVLSADCTPATKIFLKLSPHLRKWERCSLGGKNRARYCHLLLAPPSRLTPNEANKEFSMAQCV